MRSDHPDIFPLNYAVDHGTIVFRSGRGTKSFPWQAGAKNHFVRLVPTVVTGRRFPVVDPTMWHTPFSNVPRSPSE
ncbi:MAG: hypothetical protein EOP30_09080 [Rhodococcus sp. (in: high G+C Gram-positive bacteria)]|nr:MAG: hypothetical protein EOP30_09080 [Rhodococcus sp. (in: high G+C Gram-positive bacteria)]